MDKMNENDIVNDFFKEKLQDYAPSVKRDLWSSLENHIPTDTTEKRFGRRFYLMMASAAAVIIILLLSYPYMLKEPSGSDDIAVVATEKPTPEVSTRTTVEKESKIVTPEEQLTEKKDRILPAENLLPSEIFSVSEKTAISENIDVVTEEDNGIESKTEMSVDAEERQMSQVEDTVGKTTDTQEELFPEKPSGYKKQDYVPVKTKQKSVPGIQVSVSGKGFFAMNNELDHLRIYNTDYLNAYKNQFEVDEWFPAVEGGSTGMESEVKPIPVDYNLTHIKYNTPVSLSLYINKHISLRWALETGFSYTKLSSRETWEGRQSYHYEDALFTDIDLYYVGIPLRASYYIVNKSGLSVYVTGGGMIEKCVSGKAVTWSEKQDERVKTKPDISGLQFSVTGGAGVGYRLFRPIILFVEPGVVYYFDNGSNTMTIRKDKPFHFNIQGGLRFSF